MRLVHARRFAEELVAPIGGSPIAPQLRKACAFRRYISSCSANASMSDECAADSIVWRWLAHAIHYPPLGGLTSDRRLPIRKLLGCLYCFAGIDCNGSTSAECWRRPFSSTRPEAVPDWHSRKPTFGWKSVAPHMRRWATDQIRVRQSCHTPAATANLTGAAGTRPDMENQYRFRGSVGKRGGRASTSLSTLMFDQRQREVPATR
jgi:hypothetical protein